MDTFIWQAYMLKTFQSLCALIQRDKHEYLMILRHKDGTLKYRIFSVEPVISRDDGLWRNIAEGKFFRSFYMARIS